MNGLQGNNTMLKIRNDTGSRVTWDVERFVGDVEVFGHTKVNKLYGNGVGDIQGSIYTGPNRFNFLQNNAMLPFDENNMFYDIKPQPRMESHMKETADKFRRIEELTKKHDRQMHYNTTSGTGTSVNKRHPFGYDTAFARHIFDSAAQNGYLIIISIGAILFITYSL